MPSPVLDYNNHIYHEVPDLQGNLQPIHRPIQAQLNLQQVSFDTFLLPEAAFFKKGVLTTFWPIIIFFLFSVQS